MSKPLNWGVISTGFIAQAFAEAMPHVSDAKLWSVVSRSQATADAFAERYRVPRVYTSLEAFANDPELDVVVVGTPHPMHFENTLLCLNAGKHVLCEKPMALNQGQVQQMVEAAQKNNCFLMEAMWMYFNPAVNRARELVHGGAVGEPRVLMADMGFDKPFDPTSRFYDLALGGGTLLDMGIYPLSIAYFMFGKPDTVTGTATIGETGVDEAIAMTLHYEDGRLANLTATIRANTTCEAVIAGPKGYLRIHRNFWHAEKLSLYSPHGPSEEVDLPVDGNGYNDEMNHVNACIRAGKIESEIMPWRISLDFAWMMDTLRAQWGIRYPQEK